MSAMQRISSALIMVIVVDVKDGYPMSYARLTKNCGYVELGMIGLEKKIEINS